MAGATGGAGLISKSLVLPESSESVDPGREVSFSSCKTAMDGICIIGVGVLAPPRESVSSMLTWLSIPIAPLKSESAVAFLKG